jgi:ankyrin repeat protein
MSDRSDIGTEITTEERVPTSETSTSTALVTTSARDIQLIEKQKKPNFSTRLWGQGSTSNLFQLIHEHSWQHCLDYLENTYINFNMHDKSGDHLLSAISRYDARHFTGDIIHTILTQAPELLNQPNKKGRTPLEIAYLYNNANVMTELIESGADIEKSNIMPTLLLDKIISCHFRSKSNSFIAETLVKLYQEGADLLYPQRKNILSIIERIVVNNYMDNPLKELAENGYDLHMRGRHGNTLLISAAEIDDSTDTVSFLIKYGIELDAQNDRGETALFRAARLENYSIIQCLLEANANPDIPDNNGITARQIIMTCSPDQARLIQRLLRDIPTNKAIAITDQRPTSTQDTTQTPAQASGNHWSYDGDEHVICISPQARLHYSFNMEAGMLIVMPLDKDLNPCGTPAITSFEDFADDAHCYKPRFLEQAKRHYKPAP